jgi:hypothetical protein
MFQDFRAALAVRLHRGPVLDFDHLHARGALEQFGHDAFARRIEVLNNNECHAAARRHSPQELIQGFESSGGSADADDGKHRARGRGGRFRANSWNGLFLSV